MKSLRCLLMRIRQSPYRVKDVVLLLFSFLVFATSVLFLMVPIKDLSPHGEKSQPLATVTRIQNDVRHRLESGWNWSSLVRDFAIYAGDSIFTGDDSSALIEFGDGGQIDAQAKSLMVLDQLEGKYRMHLQYGAWTLRVGAGQPAVILESEDSKEVSGQNAVIQIEKPSPDAETVIRVISGEVKIQSSGSSASDSQYLKKNEMVELGGQAEKKSLPFKPIAPPENSSIWITPGRSLNFSWKMLTPVNPGTSMRFDISSQPDFSQTHVSQVLSQSSVDIESDQLPRGPLYWRVTPVGLSPIQSSANFKLFNDVPPLPNVPKDGQTFAFSRAPNRDGKSIFLAWRDEAGSTQFDYQVARDESFKQIVFAGQTRSEFADTPALTAGDYFWRVKGSHPDRKASPWSRALRFAIRAETLPADVPQLLQNVLSYEIPETVLSRAPAGVSFAGMGVYPEGLTPFNWEKIVGAEGYEIELSRTPEFANSIKQSLSDVTSFAPQEVKPGSLYFRVRARWSNGLRGQPSQTGRLDVNVPAPRLNDVPRRIARAKTEEELMKIRHVFEVNWTPRPFAETYEVEWGTDTTFERSKRFRVNGLSRKFTVTRPGEFAVRVRALGPGGEPISPYSIPVSTSFERALGSEARERGQRAAASLPALGANPPGGVTNALSISAFAPPPKPKEPLANSSLIALEGSTMAVTFTWQQIDTAGRYEIEVAQDGDFSQLLASKQSSSSSLTLKIPLPEGKVYWRVRALKGTKATEWSKVFDFNVLYQ